MFKVEAVCGNAVLTAYLPAGPAVQKSLQLHTSLGGSMRKGFWLVLVVLACLTFASAQNINRSGSMVPSGKGYGVAGSAPIHDTVNQGNGINYHGGPVMPNTVNIYLIWYGKWNGGNKPSDSQTTVNLVKGWVTGVSGSTFEMI